MKNYQNNNGPKIAMTPTLKKKLLPYKIVLACLALALAGTVLPWVILIELGKEVPFFYEHFAASLGLVFLGGICLVLPMANRVRIGGDNRGDGLMIGCAFACFILAIITLICSFLF